MQRLAGNQAVVAALGAPGAGSVELLVPARQHRGAAMLDASDVRARMPKFSDLKAALTDKKLRIPEAVIKNAVTQLLERMAMEKRLKSKDPVATIVAKIFPGPGKVSEVEFNKALDPADRTQIYQTVLDAHTTVKKADQAKLKSLMKDAGDLMLKAEGDAAGLKAVFGAQDAVAKARYASGRSALAAAAGDLDKHVTTDYNLDDPETFLGGWAQHSTQLMHLLVGVVQGVDPKESQATLVHEASHLGHGSVDDLGYYGTAAFEAMSEADKVNNAAHYEELPRRVLGVSYFRRPHLHPRDREGRRRRHPPGHRAQDRERPPAARVGRGIRRPHVAARGPQGMADQEEHRPLHRREAADPRAVQTGRHDRPPPGRRPREGDVAGHHDHRERRPGDGHRRQPGRLGAPAGWPAHGQGRRGGHGRGVGQEVRPAAENPARDKALVDWLAAHFRKLPGLP